MRMHLVAMLGLVLGAALAAASGCAVAGGSADAPGEERTPVAGMFADTRDHYYAARRDTEVCRVAPCGGYVLQALHGRGMQYRVDRLDFSSARFDAGTIRAVEEAPDGELVLYGSIERSPTGADTESFTVLRAYRGMPGIATPPGASFYVVEEREVAADCATAPCNGGVAHEVDTQSSVPFHTISVAQASAPHVDQGWLANRVLDHGALVAGNVREVGSSSGVERVLDAEQVFDVLPDRGGPCVLPAYRCPEGAQPAYTRDVDRCLDFQGCVQHPACQPTEPPRCAEGYTLSHWLATGRTCVGYACDPSFLSE